MWENVRSKPRLPILPAASPLSHLRQVCSRRAGRWEPRACLAAYLCTAAAAGKHALTGERVGLPAAWRRMPRLVRNNHIFLSSVGGAPPDRARPDSAWFAAAVVGSDGGRPIPRNRRRRTVQLTPCSNRRSRRSERGRREGGEV